VKQPRLCGGRTNTVRLADRVPPPRVDNRQVVAPDQPNGSASSVPRPALRIFGWLVATNHPRPIGRPKNRPRAAAWGRRAWRAGFGDLHVVEPLPRSSRRISFVDHQSESRRSRVVRGLNVQPTPAPPPFGMMNSFSPESAALISPLTMNRRHAFVDAGYGQQHSRAARPFPRRTRNPCAEHVPISGPSIPAWPIPPPRHSPWFDHPLESRRTRLAGPYFLQSSQQFGQRERRERKSLVQIFRRPSCGPPPALSSRIRGARTPRNSFGGVTRSRVLIPTTPRRCTAASVDLLQELCPPRFFASGCVGGRRCPFLAPTRKRSALLQLAGTDELGFVPGAIVEAARISGHARPPEWQHAARSSTAARPDAGPDFDMRYNEGVPNRDHGKWSVGAGGVGGARGQSHEPSKPNRPAVITAFEQLLGAGSSNAIRPARSEFPSNGRSMGRCRHVAAPRGRQNQHSASGPARPRPEPPYSREMVFLWVRSSFEWLNVIEPPLCPRKFVSRVSARVSPPVIAAGGPLAAVRSRPGAWADAASAASAPASPPVHPASSADETRSPIQPGAFHAPALGPGPD